MVAPWWSALATVGEAAHQRGWTVLDLADSLAHAAWQTGSPAMWWLLVLGRLKHPPTMR